MLTKLTISLLLLLPVVGPAAAMSCSSFRTVQRILPKPPQHWVGDGFHVYPVFADLAFTSAVTPMLMFDYAAPTEFPASSSKPRGVGQHPHRGFETVTMAFQGEVEHHDSQGGHDTIHPGDTQWMTAGSGIIHQEYHSKDFTKKGGVFEMCQLWVNLPKQYKMVKPRYQAITDAATPVVLLGEGISQARVIAGELLGTTGPAKTYSPINLFDVSLLDKKGTIVEIPYPSTHSCIVFVRRGSISIGNRLLNAQDVALMNTNGGDKLQLQILEKNSAVLIMGGAPIDEPIAARGPFVMNTNLELQQAMRDYQEGRF